MKNVIVTGIGTDVGKTVVAAILTEALEADYWKPVQAGDLEIMDSQKVSSLLSNPRSKIHPESYKLSAPMSPHAAAKMDGIEIELNKLSVPHTANKLIIEPPGGLMVPLNKQLLNIDLILYWGAPVILVCKNYLGSINHSLLSIELLKARGIILLGIIFNGEPAPSSEDFILEYTGVRCLAKIRPESVMDKTIVKQYANQWKDTINGIIK